MGIAEVVPGVSGGTIAFITGIYERLIDAIKSIGPGLYSSYKRGGMRAVAKEMDLGFLLLLGVGMVGGILIGVFGVHHLLESYPPVVWSFFFGLIFASFFYMWGQIRLKSVMNIGLAVVGCLVAVVICVLVPLGGSDHLLYVFACGFLAISALLLPGISGSFILLLLGMYLEVTGRVKALVTTQDSEDFVFLLVLGMGCLAGVMTLSRVLSYGLKHYRDSIVSVLTGFVLGSLVKIWPWQNPIRWVHKDSKAEFSSLPSQGVIDMDEYKVLAQDWVLPGEYYAEAYLLQCILLFLVGAILVFVLSRMAGATDLGK